jgi:hypothetical protein
MAVRLSALISGRPLPPGRFLVLISVKGRVDPRAIVRVEGIGQLRNPNTSSRIEPTTFLLDKIDNIISQIWATEADSRSPSVSVFPCPLYQLI